MTESETLIHAVFRMQSQAMRRKGDWMVLADPQGRIADVNPQCATALGYTPEELIGKPLIFIMPERYRAGHTPGMHRVRTGGESRLAGKTVKLHALTRDRKEIRVHLTVDHFQVDNLGEFSIGTMTERPLIDTRRIMTPALIFALLCAFLLITANRYLIVNVLVGVHGNVKEMREAVDTIEVRPTTRKDILEALKIVHHNADETLKTIESVIEINDEQ